MPDSPKYPERAKIAAIRDKSQEIGDFLEWLRTEKKLSICFWQDAGHNDEPRRIQATPELLERIATDFGRDGFFYKECRQNIRVLNTDGTRNPGGMIDNPYYEHWEEGWYLDGTSKEQLLADYFEIDLVKKDEEDRAMLKAIRGET